MFSLVVGVVGKYGKIGKEVGWGMATRDAGRARNERGGEGRYHLREGVGGRQRGGGGRGVQHQLDTMSIDLHHTMMRQLTTLFAKTGNLGGAQMLRGNCYDR